MLASVLSSWTESLTPGDWIDLGGLTLIFICMLIGAIRGFSGEVAGLATLGIALSGGLYFREPMVGWFDRMPGIEAHTAGFHAIIFIGIAMALLLLLWMLRKLLRRFIRLVVEPPADVVLGILAGGIRGCLLLLILFGAMALTPNPVLNEWFTHDARTGRLVQPLLHHLHERAIELRQAIHDDASVEADDEAVADDAPPSDASPHR